MALLSRAAQKQPAQARRTPRGQGDQGTPPSCGKRHAVTRVMPTPADEALHRSRPSRLARRITGVTPDDTRRQAAGVVTPVPDSTELSS